MIVSNKILTYAALLAQVVFAQPLLAQTVSWEPALAAAMERAKTEGRIVMVAMNMDDERDSDRMLKSHYADPVVVALSKQMVNVFCSDDQHKKTAVCPRCKQNACSSHRNNGFNVRRMFFGQEGHDPVRAPQHLFLTPDGKVFSSATGRVAVGELEWMIREAMRSAEQYKDLVDGGTERSHAPTSYRRGSVDAGAKALQPAPTKKQLAEAIEQSKSNNDRGGRRGRRNRGARGGSTPSWLEVLTRTEDRKAKKAVESYTKSSGQSQARVLAMIGRQAPASWQKMVSEYLSSDDEGIRRAAIVALTRMAEPKTLSALKKYHRKEKVEDLEGRFLRALAVVAPTNSAVVAVIVKAATKSKDVLVRAHAMVAAGTLELRQPVMTCLQAGLQDVSFVVRSVTAYVIAERQYRELSEFLAKSLAVESEEEARGWMEKAKAALTSRDPKEFDEFLRLTIDKPAEGRDRRGRDRGEEGKEEGKAGEGKGEGGASGEAGRNGRRRRGGELL
jgi:hypothetical protein